MDYAFLKVFCSSIVNNNKTTGVTAQKLKVSKGPRPSPLCLGTNIQGGRGSIGYR